MKSNCYNPNDVYVSDHNEEKRVYLRETHGVNSYEHHKDFIKKCDVVVIVVKVFILIFKYYEIATLCIGCAKRIKRRKIQWFNYFCSCWCKVRSDAKCIYF